MTNNTQNVQITTKKVLKAHFFLKLRELIFKFINMKIDLRPIFR